MNIGQVGTKYAMANLEAYKEGYEKGREDALGKLQEYAKEKLDMRFALDILCKQVIDEYVEQIKEKDD